MHPRGHSSPDAHSLRLAHLHGWFAFIVQGFYILNRDDRIGKFGERITGI